jgi:hypothetical protein
LRFEVSSCKLFPQHLFGTEGVFRCLSFHRYTLLVIPPQVESELRIYGECNAETVTLLLISPRLTVVVPPQVESKLRTFEEAYSEVTFLNFDF